MLLCALLFVHSLWISDMKTVIQADELPQDIAGAEELLARHSEHKMELDARKHNFQSFQNKGKKLIAASHYARLEVHE